MSKRLRKLSLVRLRKTWEKTSSTLPFFDDLPLIYLGEIPNMPQHGVFVGHSSGRIYSGYHIDQFVELPQSEV
jgi:hypothetical protein